MKTPVKRKVLYLHRTQGGGAEQVHILGIARAFENAGITVDILSPRGFECASANHPDTASASLTTRKKLLTLVSKHAPELIFELFEIAYNTLSLWRIAKRGVSDYGLIFERYAIFGVAGALLSKFARLPLIIEVNYTSKSPLVRQRSKLLKPLAHAIDRWIFKNAALLTPVSTALKRELMRDFGVPEEKILVLPNAADPIAFSPATEDIGRKEKKIIGFVGGFYPWHGLDLLIEAYAGIADDFPESQVLLIGDGPELANIQSLVSKRGLAERVIFGGRKRHQELPRVMSMFYAGVMPDSNDYGSPMKIFEYMALGIPVVAPDYGPIFDAINDGKQGVIFEKGNIAALRTALTRLLQDEVFARNLGASGRETIVHERNWNANVFQILNALADKHGNMMPAAGDIA